ncbi:hypothetical protein R80B4_01714 [Fibrobacteres bacterium R8-0-B4]
MRDGDALTETMQVAAEEESVLRLPLLGSSTGAAYSAQGRANLPTVTNAPGGKITLNLPPQSYKSAEVSLYAVNGRQILHSKAAAFEAGKRLSKRGAAPGVYLLSVKGSGGNAFTSRFAHSGGEMNIAVVFGGGNAVSPDRMPKKAAGESWTVRVSAEGYDDSVFTLRPVAGENPLVEVTLEATRMKYRVTVASNGTGGTGGGDYVEDAEVSINAGTAQIGKVFKNWTTTSDGVTFADENSAATTFIMPPNAVTVTAVFDYEFVTIGGQKWMKRNLDVVTSNSWCYDNNTANCTKYGRLYTWSAAQTACPSGWHLPTYKEWKSLIDYAGYYAGPKLKSTIGWGDNSHTEEGTDAYGFWALPGGKYRAASNQPATFLYVGTDGYWWTATEASCSSTPCDWASYIWITQNFSIIDNDTRLKSDGMSVRCIKND